jgi:hypothetical protein
MTKELRVTYAPKYGNGLADHRAKEYADVICAQVGDYPYPIGNMLVIMNLRLALKQKKIKSLIVGFEGVDYNFDENGRSDFFLAAPDYYGDLLSDLL